MCPSIPPAGVCQSFLRARDTQKKGDASLTGQEKSGVKSGPESGLKDQNNLVSCQIRRVAYPAGFGNGK